MISQYLKTRTKKRLHDAPLYKLNADWQPLWFWLVEEMKAFMLQYPQVQKDQLERWSLLLQTPGKIIPTIDEIEEIIGTDNAERLLNIWNRHVKTYLKG